MKLIFQADDFGLTEGTALGIEKCIKNGSIKNTGLFVNMPATKMAVNIISNYPNICLGVDINLTAGKPVSDLKYVEHIVDNDGYFLSSKQVIGNGKIVKHDGMITYFEKEPYDYEETYHEIEQQVLRFKELVGKWPAYLHPHSLITPVTHKIMQEIAGVYNLKYTLDLWAQHGMEMFEMPWNMQKDFTWDAQLATNVEKEVQSILPSLKYKDVIVLICHPGYVDIDLFQYSSFTSIRIRDMEMASSKDVIDVINKLNIKQITYEDF